MPFLLLPGRPFTPTGAHTPVPLRPRHTRARAHAHTCAARQEMNPSHTEGRGGAGWLGENLAGEIFGGGKVRHPQILLPYGLTKDERLHSSAADRCGWTTNCRGNPQAPNPTTPVGSGALPGSPNHDPSLARGHTKIAMFQPTHVGLKGPYWGRIGPRMRGPTGRPALSGGAVPSPENHMV